MDGLGVARTYGGLLVASEASGLLALGRWSEVDPLLAAALEREPPTRAGAALHLQAARLAIGRGSFEDAARHLDIARARDGMAGGGEQRLPILAASAELALWERRFDEIRIIAEEGLGAIAEIAEPAHAWLAATALRAEGERAEIARARQDRPALDDAAARGRALAARLETFAGTGNDGLARRFAALAALGSAEATRLTAEPAPDLWAAAAGGFEAAGRPYPAAYAHYREAEAFLAAGRGRSPAEGPLRAAWSAASALGAAPLLAEIEQLARQGRIQIRSGAANAKARTIVPGGPPESFGLTDREAEVLRLVAGGWTNRQIGEALFISAKTASVHVSNILGKLGVDSRVEAAGIAFRLGLAADAPPPPDVMSEVSAN